MPCLNSSGNVASDASSTPRARSPSQVKATFTQRLSPSTVLRTLEAERIFSRIPASQALAPAVSWKVRNSYRPVSAGVRVTMMCWISSSSSIITSAAHSLHLVQHVRERRLQPQRLLDLFRAHVGVLAVLEEAGTLVLADEREESRRVGLPVQGEALQVLEHRIDVVLGEERDRILGVLVEIGVEDALIHEVGLMADIEEHPPEVMQLEHSEAIRQALDGVLDLVAVLTDGLLRTRFDLGDDGKSVVGGGLGINRAVPSLLQLEESFPGNRHRCGLGPVFYDVRRRGLWRSPWIDHGVRHGTLWCGALAGSLDA